MIKEILSVKPFAVIGHRGAGGEKPENTLSAISHGISAGADIVEVDVRKTKDGKLVLFHDKDLKRLTGRAVPISQLDYSFIEENVRIDGERIPLLEEALELVGGKAGIFIEIKEPETTPRIIQTVKENDAISWVCIISFYEEALSEAKKLIPEITTGLIYMRPPGKILEAKQIGADVVLPVKNLATEKAVRFAHRMGLKVVSWVINDFETAEIMYQKGVNGIASDYPSMAVEWKNRLKGG
ncbi:glycerophosphodiester phosphodiesterase [Persephonella sp.]